MIRRQKSSICRRLSVSSFVCPDAPTLNSNLFMDTGFAGYLTLPFCCCRRSQPPLMPGKACYVNLADDSPLEVIVHDRNGIVLGRANFNGVFLLQAMGRRPLLGMLLLEGCNLNIDFVEGKPFTPDEIIADFSLLLSGKKPSPHGNSCVGEGRPLGGGQKTVTFAPYGAAGAERSGCRRRRCDRRGGRSRRRNRRAA